MPAWITLTLADLNEARAAKLVEALRTKALAEGQADPMPGTIAKVASELRDSIAFGGRPLSATENTLPPGLKDLAVQHIICVMKKRLLQSLTDDEKAGEAVYEKRLGSLNAGNWPVEAPDDPQETPTLPAQTGYYGGDEKVPLF